MTTLPTLSFVMLLAAFTLAPAVPGQQVTLGGGRPKARPAPTPPSSDSVLSFDGNNDRVTVPYDASFPTQVFTIAAWIKLSIPTGRAAIIARGEDDDSFNLSWQLFVQGVMGSGPGTLQLMLEDSNENNYCYPLNNCFPGGSCVSGNLFVADDAWHFVAATRTASGVVAIYIDGELRGFCTGTGVPSSNNAQALTVGCTHGQIGIPTGPEPPIWFFPGLIDDAAMWDVPLDAAAITALFATGVDPTEPSLRGYWSFDEGAGQVVEDLSGTGNDGYRGDDPGQDDADPEWLTP